MEGEKITKFEISDYLDNEEMIGEYLNTVLEEGDSEDLIVANGHVVKAIGMTENFGNFP
ncbi:MAG TPA: hypothetical protein VFF21_10365 [Flavobacteriaceae bacterium]|nr:hypothetical protein [Flavobacteriaceae bacterium]